ncbi:hypothetical protein FRC07_008435, partial [Ceratobasidium sp. 392]
MTRTGGREINLIWPHQKADIRSNIIVSQTSIVLRTGSCSLFTRLEGTEISDLLYEALQGEGTLDILFYRIGDPYLIETVLQLGQIGDSLVNNKDPNRPKDAPSVSRPAMPRWYPTELGYRATAVWRAILTVAMEQGVDDPVARYLDTQVPVTGGAVQTAQYPDSVRNLIKSNSKKIHTGGIGKTWIGMKTKFNPGGNTNAFAGVQVGFDQRVKSKQGGASGPFSLEAAFIVASQLAGVNFKAVASTIRQSEKIDTWWSGVLMPGKKGTQASECFNEDAAASGARLYGRYKLSGSSGQHDTDAGVYVAFDLDPMAKPDAEDHNVFVFVTHAIDAHAGILRRKVFEDWLRAKATNDPEAPNFPVYTQISELHLYILTEDWDGRDTDTWPRKNWL